MSSPWMPLNNPWQFDPLSALIGAGAGLLAGAATAYRLRANIEGAFQSFRRQAEHTRERLTMGAQQRYLEWLAGRVSSLHLLREGAKLSELYVEPEFMSPPPRPAVSGRATEPPPPTVPLSVVMKATHRLAITNAPGSGRTALLAHIALTVGQAAYQDQTAWGLPEHTLPVYVHLGELVLQTVEPAADAPADQPMQAKTNRVDPTQVLLEALAARMPILVQNSAPGLVRERLKNGQALLLLDGMDELESEAKSAVLVWLKGLLAANPQAYIVVTTAPAGYAPLIELGFTAMPLAPWKATHVTHLANLWMKAAKGSEEDARQLASMLKPAPGTSPLPMDVILSAFIWQKHNLVSSNRATIYGQMIDTLTESIQATSPLSPMLARGVLGRLALTLFTENRKSASRAEIEKAITELLAPPAQIVPALRPEAEPASPADAETGAPTDLAPAPAAKPQEPPKPKGVPESVEAVLKCGLMMEQSKDRFVFAHCRLQAYLAAWQITQTGSGAALAQHLDDTEWSDVFEFCAGLVNVGPIVDAMLKRDASPTEGDLFHARLWTVAQWAAAAGQEAAWRGKVLAQVAAQFMQANQLPPLRERAVLALLSTQDKGLGYVFKQALASPNPSIRALAVRGLGLLGREQDLPTFEAALQDADVSVQEEAVRAMAAVGGHASIEHLASVLLTAAESLRRTASLMLAENEADGWRILKEAAHEEDMLVRRAATFGLAHTRQEWAREILVRLEHEDKQWFVRSAATEAITSMEAVQEYELDCSPVELDRQGWLIEWAATRGIAVGLGRSAEPVLTRALSEGDLGVKLAVIHSMAHLGRESDIATLRQQLAAPEPLLQEAAYQALQMISDKMSLKIKRG